MENTSVFSKIRDMVDKAVLYDEFEMDKLDVSQMVSIDQQRRSTFFIIYIYIYILDLHHQEFKGDVDIVLFAYFDDVFECIASPIIVESVLVG